MDAAKTERAGGLYVFGNVVDENGLSSGSFHGLQGRLEDDRRRFGGANRARVDTGRLGNVVEKAECGFEVVNVNRIGIGNQSELVSLREGFEKIVGLKRLGIETTVPGVTKVAERNGTAK